MAEVIYTVLTGAHAQVRLRHGNGEVTDLCVKGPFELTDDVAKGWLR